ncbi:MULTISPECIES: hypothetical protein [Bradyrhizobium]|uniref:hypothetical protein n=1 Tax=Bradyrhizobium TaxID=374 RepID=UPI0004019519|nr:MULTISPECIES: hypothetical protein [Bradyrhizobium]UFW53500.1 hypothetical protein BaraCB756_21755 [Bradyrhizobium arachidis]
MTLARSSRDIAATTVTGFIAGIISGLQQREQALPVLIAASLLFPHSFKLGLCFGRVLILLLHFDNERLLLCEPPFAFDDVALHLLQFIVYRSPVHHDPRAAVLRIRRRVISLRPSAVPQRP